MRIRAITCLETLAGATVLCAIMKTTLDTLDLRERGADYAEKFQEAAQRLEIMTTEELLASYKSDPRSGIQPAMMLESCIDNQRTKTPMDKSVSDCMNRVTADVREQVRIGTISNAAILIFITGLLGRLVYHLNRRLKAEAVMNPPQP